MKQTVEYAEILVLVKVYYFRNERTKALKVKKIKNLNIEEPSCFFFVTFNEVYSFVQKLNPNSHLKIITTSENYYLNSKFNPKYTSYYV